MKRLELMKILPAIALAVTWIGCGGDSVDLTSGNDGGTKDSSASDSASDTSTNSDSSSSDAATDTSQSDVNECLLYHESCDLTNDQCCAPMTCQQTTDNTWCRSPDGDSGETCQGSGKDCSAIACCPGLECVVNGEEMSCSMADAGIADASPPPDAPVDSTLQDTSTGDSASCLLYHETCDQANDQCCAPMTCQQFGATAWCRSPDGDSGEICQGAGKDCSSIACCPGLACETDGGSMSCVLVDSGILDASPIDAPVDSWVGDTATVDSASCLLYHVTCDQANDQCCSPMTCQHTGGSTWCRSPDADSGETCQGNGKDCTTIACCPGLTCLNDQGSMTCGYVDGGT